MNKKTLGRIAAASLAAMTAVSAMGITASANIGYDTNGKINGTVYQVITTTGGGTDPNGVPIPTQSVTTYYVDQTYVPAGLSSTAVNVTTAFGYGKNVYVLDGVISTTNTAGSTALTTTTAGQTTTTPIYGSTYQYASSNDRVYQGGSGTWYPNYSSLVAAGESLKNSLSLSSVSTYSYMKSAATATGRVYFNPTTGTYSADAPTETSGYLIYGYDNYYYDDYYNDYYYRDYGTYDVYKVNGVFYPTLSSALSAAGNNYALITKVYDYSKPQTNYFSKVTGKYYTTYSAALSASRGISSNVYTFSYYSTNYDYDDPYYYSDPYYYYWLNNQSNKNNNTTSTKDTTTATVGNRKGWTAVSKYLASLKSGSSVSVSMNTETTIPASAISAIDGKNVTVKFVLKNGVVFTINGKDVSTATSIDIDTAYNTNRVPSKLVKAAYKKNKAVSSAQITISGGSFGADADVTVKFATKRAGCTAKLYRYNSSRDTLSLVDTATVQSNGKCTFDGVDKGGNFVITLS